MTFEWSTAILNSHLKTFVYLFVTRSVKITLSYYVEYMGSDGIIDDAFLFESQAMWIMYIYSAVKFYKSLFVLSVSDVIVFT